MTAGLSPEGGDDSAVDGGCVDAGGVGAGAGAGAGPGSTGTSGR